MNLKRLIITGAVVFAVLGLLLPGLIGFAADARHRAAVEQISDASGGATLQADRFERGWFSSTGSYRLALADTRIDEVRRALGLDSSGEPALVIESRIQHGPFAGAGAMPVLATVDSELYLEGFAAERVRIPGDVETTLYLTGAGQAVWTVEPVSHRGGDGNAIDWQGGRLVVNFDTRGTGLLVDAVLGSLALQATDGRIQIERSEFDGDMRQSEAGLWTGTTHVAVTELLAEPAGATGLRIGRLALDSESEVVDGALAATTRLEAADITLPQSPSSLVELEVVVRGLDAASMAEINRRLSTAGSEIDPSATHSALLAALSRLAAAGGELEIRMLRIESAHGDIQLRALFDLEPDTLADVTSARQWLTELTASARLDIDRGLLEQAGALDPRITQTLLGLTASGFARETEQGYEVEAEYHNGLLTLNGNPLPIPLPAN